MPTAHADTVIIGGGIAGLWTLRRAQAAGRAAVLLEADALGAVQTGASQGMVHGGIKYALGAGLTGASEAIAGMPERWRACLAGHGEIELSAARVLSEHYYMWSNGDVRGRLGSFLASKALRGRVEPVTGSDRPAVFRLPGFKGQVYRLADVVLDVPELLNVLAAPSRPRIRQLGVDAGSLDADNHRLHWQADGKEWALTFNHLVLTAGAGNGPLLAQLGIAEPRMQLRPLHQVMVFHQHHEPLHAHCINAITKPEPRLTVTSHRCADGRTCWYLGGALSTGGVERSAGEQLAVARDEVAACLPWLDLGAADWATWRVDRAEPLQRSGLRPDQAFAQRVGDSVVAWPSKLSLAPDLADRVLEQLDPPTAVDDQALDRVLASLPDVRVANPGWLQPPP